MNKQVEPTIELLPASFYEWVAQASDAELINRGKQALADFRNALASDDDTGCERANAAARACKNRLHELGY